MLDPALIKSALADAEQLAAANPDMPTLHSIVAQLYYLLALAEGRESDRSRLSEIVLGVQAAREVEPLDEPLAEKLYRISSQVRTIT